ncbi:hypothetical protein A3J43_01765 [Candidatus Uhrbacteria bacterium RIFCSPHIGHO2_12_FULL_54_23]|uniref:Cobalamin biosynthesis protein CbiM n=1 Tax=Candidatus Uhrbacteria bacterium RIFCSPHIGHO2_12_FULL_54_23 TaxID=1802397 RepID=A0A1F7UIP9_9BACT|nr:MAG: hypothetical protein A3J43_01765 [Candidatus Uhrbacteria bacterium RIFCSPHIGHO2_12_FULL_54_23]
MHLPDGFLNHGTASGLAGAAAAAVSFALAKVRAAFLEKVPVLKRRFATFPDMGGGEVSWQSRFSVLGREKMWQMASVGSLIFAAQMVNFPIAGGTSGHVLGGVLAALIVGPFEGLIVIALVLAVQAFAFGDGGVWALGANIINMGLVGTLGGYGLFVLAKKLMKNEKKTFLLCAGCAAWLSVVAAAGAASVELSVSGTAPFASVLSAMMRYHVLIGLGEMVITVGILAALKKKKYPIAALESEKEKVIP